MEKEENQNTAAKNHQEPEKETAKPGKNSPVRATKGSMAGKTLELNVHKSNSTMTAGSGR